MYLLIIAKPMSKPTNQSHMNYSALEPVLFENYTVLNCPNQYLELPLSSNLNHQKLH